MNKIQEKLSFIYIISLLIFTLTKFYWLISIVILSYCLYALNTICIIVKDYKKYSKIIYVLKMHLGEIYLISLIPVGVCILFFN